VWVCFFYCIPQEISGSHALLTLQVWWYWMPNYETEFFSFLICNCLEIWVLNQHIFQNFCYNIKTCRFNGLEISSLKQMSSQNLFNCMLIRSLRLKIHAFFSDNDGWIAIIYTACNTNHWMPNKYFKNKEIDQEYINNVMIMCLFVYVYIYDILYGLYMQLLIFFQRNKIIHQNTMTTLKHKIISVD
jgi:hypothetical protein